MSQRAPPRPPPRRLRPGGPRVCPSAERGLWRENVACPALAPPSRPPYVLPPATSCAVRAPRRPSPCVCVHDGTTGRGHPHDAHHVNGRAHLLTRGVKESRTRAGITHEPHKNASPTPEIDGDATRKIEIEEGCYWGAAWRGAARRRACSGTVTMRQCGIERRERERASKNMRYNPNPR